MLQWTQGFLRSFELVFCVPSDTLPEVGLLGQKADPFLIFEVSPYCFPQWVHQSTFPPIVPKGSPFSTSSPALAVCWFIDDEHSDRCEMVSHYSFVLHFSDDYWHWASFCISVGHLYVLLGEMFTQVICPFFNWIVCYLGVDFYKFLINIGY